MHPEGQATSASTSRQRGIRFVISKNVWSSLPGCSLWRSALSASASFRQASFGQIRPHVPSLSIVPSQRRLLPSGWSRT